jgi:hypothetical protein
MRFMLLPARIAPRMCNQSMTFHDPASATSPRPADSPRTAATRTGAVLRALALLPAGFWLLMVLLPPVNHDVAAVFDYARRWLDGERLYRDLFDVNPPLIFILNLVPAAIAAWTPVGPVAALVGCLLLLAAGLWRMTLALRRGRAEGPVEAALLTAAIPALLLMAGTDFGQREAIMAMAAIPYALLAARRMEEDPPARRLSLSVALVAALAFALKPHFLVVPLLVEGLVVLRRGWARALRDPVPWTMAAVWTAYVAMIVLAFPAYAGHVLPLAFAFYDDIQGTGPWHLLLTEQMGTAVLLLAVTLPLALMRRAGALAQALACCAVGAFIVAWAQQKGWSYHILPVTLLGLATALVLAARWADAALPADRARAAAPGLAAMLVFAASLHLVRGGETPWRQLWFEREQVGQMTAWLRREAMGARILLISPDIFPAHGAMLHADARPVARFMSTWLLQGLYSDCPPGPAPYRAPAAMSDAEALVFATYAADLAARMPDAVLVSRHTNVRGCGGRFDLLAYFTRHPAFAEAWSRYRLVGEQGGYRLFLRRT